MAVLSVSMWLILLLMIQGESDARENLKAFRLNCADNPWILDCSIEDVKIVLISENGMFMREKNFSMEEDKNFLEHPISGDPPDQFGEIFDSIINVALSQSHNRAYLRLFSGNLLAAEDAGNLQAEKLDCSGKNENRDCLKAQWVLNVVSDQFLLIHSAAFPTYFIAVTNGKMSLTTSAYFFSGIKSQFFVGVNLLSQGTEPRGEVVLSYYNRQATMASGYICDEGWGKEEADTICRASGFEEGLPTYKSHYMNISDALFVASNFKCSGQEGSLKECKSDNACGDRSTRCLAQQGVNLNNGICTGSDVAGVVCGSREEIVEELTKIIKCDKVLEERSYIGQMFQIKQEIANTKQIVFSNRRWGEYVEPFPETDGQVSLVLIKATGLNRSMDLRAPMLGWQFLEGPDLWAGLVQIATSLSEAFKSVSEGMTTINYNTKVIHMQIIYMAQFAFLKDNSNLLESLESIRNLTADSGMLMHESYLKFDNMAHMLRELVGGLKSNNRIEGDEAKQLKKVFDFLNESIIANGEKKRELEDERATAMVATTELYNKIKLTVNKYCESYFIDTTEVCNSCAYRGPTDECFMYGRRCVDKKPAICNQTVEQCEYKNNTCTEEECAKYAKMCQKVKGGHCWQECVKHRCLKYTPVCRTYRKVCIHELEECQQEEKYCIEYKPEGNFCLDGDGKKDKPCQKGGLCRAMKQLQKKGFELSEIIKKESLEQNLNSFIDDHVQKMLGEMQEIVVQINTTFIDSTEKAGYQKEDLTELTNVLDKLLKSLPFSYGSSLNSLKKIIEEAALEDTNTLEKAISDASSVVKFHKDDVLKDSQNLVSNLLARMKNELFSDEVIDCQSIHQNVSQCFEWTWKCTIQNCVEGIPQYNWRYKEYEPTICESFNSKCVNYTGWECSNKRHYSFSKLQCRNVTKEFIPWKTDFTENIKEYLQSTIKQAKTTKQLEAHKKVMFTDHCQKSINLNSTAFNHDEINYIIAMTQSLTNLYRHWAQLNDLFSSLKVLVDVFEYKAEEMSGWIKDIELIYPGKEMADVFMDIMKLDTRSALATNLFIFFVTETLMDFTGNYPIIGFESILNMSETLRKSPYLRKEEEAKVKALMEERKNFIKQKVISLSIKLEERMKKELMSLENDLSCAFENASENTTEALQIGLKAYKIKVKNFKKPAP